MDMKQKVIDSIKTHKDMVVAFERNCVDSVVSAAEMIIKSIKVGGCVYICGNGGSAADAQHIAGEFVGRFLKDRKAMPAVALTTDTSLITAIGNDYGFDDIFRRQVEGLVGADDVLWAFSTSGSSANIIAAAKLAKDTQAAVLAFTGRADSELEKIADVTIVINTPNSAPAQEIHQLAYHIICDLVESALC
ncbi:MAG: D-sedoheptulose-7-phosphate isomerase [Planctomycetota bacterium]|jgi:D-sedoheptulose 7-phosphate isomerase